MCVFRKLRILIGSISAFYSTWSGCNENEPQEIGVLYTINGEIYLVASFCFSSRAALLCAFLSSTALLQL